MQKLFLAGACWAFWIIYVIVSAKTSLRSGVFLWPLVKVALAAGVAGYVASVVLRSPDADPAQDEEPAWRQMPLLVRIILAAVFFCGGLGIIAASLASPVFGWIGVVIGVVCLPIAVYFLVAGKYNPKDAF